MCVYVLGIHDTLADHEKKLARVARFESVVCSCGPRTRSPGLTSALPMIAVIA